MIYLIHPATRCTRVCERDNTAERAEARGYVRKSRAEWLEAQRANDEETLERIRAEDAAPWLQGGQG